MSREIQFRAWNTVYKEMIFGNEYCCGNYSFGWGSHNEELFFGGKTGEYDADYLILQQYTGLTDKNGKEIYEGDILQEDHFPFHKDVVFWASSKDGYDFNGWLCKHFTPIDGYAKVIGNIYENPELLEK